MYVTMQWHSDIIRIETAYGAVITIDGEGYLLNEAHEPVENLVELYEK